MSIRVQSGTARGRAIKSLPVGLEVRPILARIRKSLFDILRPRLAESRFLDLFAGTGTVGIEALSNGASFASFVDASPSSCRMIEKNLSELGFTGRSRVFQSDVVQQLPVLAVGVFDIIFMGPPYKDEAKNPLALTVPGLHAVHKAGAATPDTLVIAQHHKKEPITDLPMGWSIVREKNYGDSVLTFFRWAGL